MNPTGSIKQVATEKAELSILRTLAYFDIFQYPLTENEIKQFLNQKLRDIDIETGLKILLSDGSAFRMGQFYTLRNDDSLLKRREDGNNRASLLLPKAIKIGGFLYRFPYIRGVALSGSLSKNFADEKADIDFFLITKKNRLWIARTILHIFKKFTFLSGRQNLYCMNYFIDEEALPIPEKNIYTATEIMTILPLAGEDAIKKFFGANNWVQDYLPNYTVINNATIPQNGSWFKRFIEWLFNKTLGNRVDDFFFRWTTRRWKRKQELGRRNSKGLVMALITGKHFAKSDPGSFQEKIVTLYEEKIADLKKHWPKYV